MKTYKFTLAYVLTLEDEFAIDPKGWVEQESYGAIERTLQDCAELVSIEGQEVE